MFFSFSHQVLDEDPSVTNDYLVREDRKGRKVIEMYPHVARNINRSNGWTLITSTMILACFFVNAIISAILVFRDYYAGFRTVTTFLTNVFLMIQVFFNHWNLSRVGWKSGVAYSFFKSDPSVYNNIDRSLRSDPAYFVPRKPAAGGEGEGNGPRRNGSGRRENGEGVEMTDAAAASPTSANAAPVKATLVTAPPA